VGLSFTDPDRWYEEYESASLERRYDILTETLDQPHFPTAKDESHFKLKEVSAGLWANRLDEF
jgi:hypothetical protein